MKPILNLLETGIKKVKNVNRYNIGVGSLKEINDILLKRRKKSNNISGKVVFFIDEFFTENMSILDSIKFMKEDKLLFVSTKTEPKTNLIDAYVNELHSEGCVNPSSIVGIGGGITMDTAKAVSNLLTNGGKAADYQGWDLVKKPGIFKIGVPTISGTGAEATRTCVMTNEKSGLKLGMNSDYTVFDHIIMDPDLTKTVPRDQYFYTGMDAYIHCIESLNGSYRNAIGDSYSRETIRLCREVFNSEDMMSDENREKLMVASYLGGCAIATSYVGVIHPFSAGLSVALGVHHCVGNCITMRGMEEYYPAEYEKFWSFANKQKIKIPTISTTNLNDNLLNKLYDSTVIHEKPLTNALGDSFREDLNYDKVSSVFKMM
jgi:3-deoxy-alpha-D-manno-octulosonate 8-oxidase